MPITCISKVCIQPYIHCNQHHTTPSNQINLQRVNLIEKLHQEVLDNGLVWNHSNHPINSSRAFLGQRWVSLYMYNTLSPLIQIFCSNYDNNQVLH